MILSYYHCSDVFIDGVPTILPQAIGYGHQWVHTRPHNHTPHIMYTIYSATEYWNFEDPGKKIISLFYHNSNRTMTSHPCDGEDVRWGGGSHVQRFYPIDFHQSSSPCLLWPGWALSISDVIVVGLTQIRASTYSHGNWPFSLWCLRGEISEEYRYRARATRWCRYTSWCSWLTGRPSL